ncbi:type VI secretion protein [Pseudomonas sp. EL_65y_Pfl2_R95]
MKPHFWAITLIAVLMTVAGCTSNFKFNDDEFRPLGDPQADERSNSSQE